MERSHKNKAICNKSYLQVGCKDENCKCSSKKKEHIREDWKIEKKRYWFFKRKPFRKNTSSRCCLRGREGYFAKNCPNKQSKTAKLVDNVFLRNEVDTYDAEVESLFSEQEGRDRHTAFAIEATTDEDGPARDIHYILMTKCIPVLRTSYAIQEETPSPNIKCESKYLTLQICVVH